MRLKRFFSFALSVALGLTLTACGGGPAADAVRLNADAPAFDADPEPESLPAFAALFAPKRDDVKPQSDAIAKAVYPQTVPYPQEEDYLQPGGMDHNAYFRDYETWLNARRTRPDLTADDVSPLAAFFRSGTRQFLTGADNRVCSPLNIYMALAMLSELTAGNTRQQILDVLGASSADAVRGQANKIWNALYTDDGVSTTILGASLWLNEQIRFNADTLQKLSESFYASSYAGKPGSPEFDAALQGWLNEQTRGLLSEQVGGVKMSPQTLLALATTIYFKANWENEFNAYSTTPDVFHAADGDRDAPFMRQTYWGNYYRGDGFSAVHKPLRDSGMWLLLPDEGVSPADLLENGAAMNFVSASERPEGMRSEIALSLPKFDVSSDLDLIDGLKALGVTDAFDAAVSDFSPMTTDAEQIEISQAKHAARVKIDEEGCEAAAFTVMMAEATAALETPPRVDFTLDRPFLFAVTGEASLPLFVGVVQTPVDA